MVNLQNIKLHQLGKIFSVNGKRSRIGITWYDYVKNKQKPEKICNWLFMLNKKSGQRPDNYVLYGRDRLKVEWEWFYAVSKCMGIFKVRLKAIKYKENSFYYFFSYPPDLSFQIACLLTLFFQPYTFKTFVSLAKHIYFSKPSWILNLFYNLNFYLLSFLLISKVNFFCNNLSDQTSGNCICYVQ